MILIVVPFCLSLPPFSSPSFVFFSSFPYFSSSSFSAFFPPPPPPCTYMYSTYVTCAWISELAAYLVSVRLSAQSRFVKREQKT